MTTFDVIVVGGGPAGMTLAGDLARAGRSVAVIERWPERNPASRAFATMARTMEVLDSRVVGARSLADRLLELGSTTDRIDLWPGAAVDLSRLDSPYPMVVVTPQTNVDRLLEDYARENGAQVERGTEVVALQQDDAGVTVTAEPKGGGPRSTWRARYVAAADGSHSTVRDLLGVDFPGKAVLSSVVLADVTLAHPPTGTGLTLGTTAEEFAFLAPYGNGWYRSMTWSRDRQLPDDAPVEDSDVSDVLDRGMGRAMGVSEIGWRSRFHCDERQVEQYRHGRVFLLGDAAHVHSPMGGQGMNTGIQDAINLAWKLDAALDGAPDGVLDSYHDERHPIGRRVLLQSGAMMRGVTVHSRLGRAARGTLATWLLGRRWAADLVAGSFSGVGLRYRAPRGGSRLVGTLATRVPLTQSTVLAQLREPGFLLVRERGAPPVDHTVRQAERADDGPAVLVRPDGYVAWVDAAGVEGSWSDVLARWTGDLDRRVMRIEAGDSVVTAIERFSLDGSEKAPGPGNPEDAEDLATHTQEPDSSTSPALDRPETARVAAYLGDSLRARPGFVAGLLLAGHDGELVLYSQWRTDGAAPEQIPDDWSIAPVLDGVTRVDARTYRVEFTAPTPATTASTTTPHAHFGVFTVPPQNQEWLLELARTHAPDSIGTPGLRSINFHRSLDGRRVINLGLWSGFEEFTALLSTPGFGGGEEYWGEVAGFRPHYFDVAALVTAPAVE